MPRVFDRVRQATATTGTGTITLGAASAGYRTVTQAGAVDGDVVRYVIEEGTAWEIGLGTIAGGGTTMVRTLVASSTGALLNLTGAATVFLTATAADVETPQLRSYRETNPPNPDSGVVLFSRRKARDIPTWRDFDSETCSLQPAMFTNRSWLMTAGGAGSTSVFAMNVAAPTGTGTATARALSNTAYGMTRRVGYIPASATANLATGWSANSHFNRGSVADMGGFFLCGRFGFNAVAAGDRAFTGFATAATTTGNPSALLSMVGVGKDATDTNFQFMHNDGTGAAVKVDTGIPYAANVLYEVRVYCPPNAAFIRISIENVFTRALADYTATTDLPSQNVLMGPYMQGGNGTNAVNTSGQIDCVSLYVETDA